MAHSYIATAHKPTAAQHCEVGDFLGPGRRSLVVSFGTRIEVWRAADDGGGLQRVCEQPLRGRVTMLKLFRPGGAGAGEVLMVLFERLQYCVLRWDAAAERVATVDAGDLRDTVSSRVETGDIGLVSPCGRLAAFHLYQGLLKVAHITPEGGLKPQPYSLPLEELTIIDICFLSPRTAQQCGPGAGDAADLPALAVLSEDGKHRRHVKTYRAGGPERELAEAPFRQDNVESSAQLLIPVADPLGGLLVVGDVQVSYVSPWPARAACTIPIRNYSRSRPAPDAMDDDEPAGGGEASFMRAWCEVDPRSFLLGDFAGRLYTLKLETGTAFTDGAVELCLEALGYTSIPSCLGWLGADQLVYVGSSYGDSAAVRLLAEPSAETATRVEVVDTFTNLGPVLDFCVVDTDSEGQGTVVACSGGYRDGSIRVIRNGVGITELAALPDIAGVRGMWSLRAAYAAEHDDVIVISFVVETKTLGIEGDELAETAVAGFDARSATVLCCNVRDAGTGADYWLQVTPGGARLVSAATRALAHQWAASLGDGVRVSVAAAAGSQVLVAGGRELLYFEVTGGELREVGRAAFEHDVACVSVPEPDAWYDGGGAAAAHCAVGLWTEISARVLSLPALRGLLTERLGGEALPRSVLLQRFGGAPYLVCGMADGTAALCELRGVAAAAAGAEPPPVELVSRKKLTLGTQPVALRSFHIAQPARDGVPGGRQHAAFAASDKPAVLYATQGKVTLSNVNLRSVQHVCPFNAAALGEENCLAFVTDGSLLIGAVDGIQKLHVRSVPLGEQPRRIVRHAPSKHFALLTHTPATAATAGDEGAERTDGDPVEQHFVRLLSYHTYEVLHTLALEPHEQGQSLHAITFSEDPNQYIVVGTAYMNSEEPEPQYGRVLVLQVSDGRLTVVAEKECKGAVYCLDAFNGKLLAGVNSTIQLWRWQEAASDGVRDLQLECSHNGHIITLTIQSRGDFIVFGDLMRSVTVLLYRSLDSSLEEIAHDFNPMWLTALAVVADDSFIAAEHDHNLFAVRHNSDAASDEMRRRLDECGFFGLGEFVNAFRKGSLVAAEATSAVAPPHARGYCDPAVPVSFLPGMGLLYGTVSGAVGTVSQLPPALFQLLQWMQDALKQTVECPSQVAFDDWRAFQNDQKKEAPKAFIDGDLIETFHELPPEKQQRVVEMVNSQLDAAGAPDAADAPAGAASARFTTASLTRVVDELTRLH